MTGVLAASIWMLPVAALAQKTQIVAPKNKYKVQDDIKLGNDAASQVERQFPIMNDADATAYVERVGRRLVAAIPPQFRQPAFNYRFKLVDASDINAFALPGGPMYVNRGMIQSARNEGEMAGVMAHEISHVALRHATAQQTKATSAKSVLGTIGLVLGGAVLGGDAGAQLGALGAAAWMTKYSREYESQADTLGAQIMAEAGYDPRDLANVFQTIQQESKGSGAPEWLSDHPDPGNRYEKINREASFLQVSANPIKITRDFERIQARFRGMPRARTMSEIERQGGGRTTTNTSTNPSTGGRYAATVQYPSTQVRSYSGVNWLSINVPSNWVDLPGQGSLQFAPAGAYGDQGITRGVMLGVYRGQNSSLAVDTNAYLSELLQGNSYLQQRGSTSQTYLAGRQAYTASFAGRSSITGRTEIVTVYTTKLKSGGLFYAATVVPENESFSYAGAFKNLLTSIRLND